MGERESKIQEIAQGLANLCGCRNWRVHRGLAHLRVEREEEEIRSAD